ncbi:BQ2448_886 [Microbotryum intermedium]|uniref:BQ2448_886 protein n=1 Tax=Microbotryum intermedium TaxID=269621 RepID=A0A238F6H2_9BASI|nr:BQ2448_886 [Microbotryum intermedium]
MPSLHDTRVLENLIKAEKNAEASFKAYTKDAASAASALSAWSVADSGDTQDIMASSYSILHRIVIIPDWDLEVITLASRFGRGDDFDVSIRIFQLASAVTESRRAHATALHVYRVSLKDVLAREQALKTVVRDREILVGKLMKLGNKKPNDSALHSHQAKLDDAQRELTACETYLQDEEIALSHAKRQTFRVGLAERMVSLGELGRVMDKSAHESHGLLVALGQDGEGDRPHFDRFEHRDDESIASDSITPSHSASQAMSRSSSSSSLEDQIVEQTMLRPSSRAQANGSTAVERAASPHRSKSPTFALGPIASGAPPDRLVSRQPTVRATPPPAPRPILGPVPTAPRPVSAYLAQEAAAASALPSFEIPKAPTHVATRRPTDDSSDEEETRDFVANQNGLSRAQCSAHYPNDMPTSTSYVANRLQRHAPPSDTSSIAGGSKVSKRRGSIFGGLAALFKKKERRVDDSAARAAVMGGNSWDTRIDRNVFIAQKGANGGRAASVAPSRLRPGNDSSDDEPTQRNLVRVVNDPKMRAKAMSDLGRSRAASLHTVTTETVKKKKATKRAAKAASDSGTISPSTRPINHPSPTFLARPVSTVIAPATEETPSVKKKKKVSSSEGAATIVLSAEKLGIPTNAGASTATRPSQLSRSNTVTSNATVATATTGTVKKKKKKVVDDAAPAVPPVPSAAKNQSVPTAIDLAASLPSARGTVYDTLTSPLPLPNGTPVSRPSSPAPVDAAPKANKVPKALAETGKRAKKESALHGNATWVSHPSAATALPKKAGHAGEGQESMMSVVDRAEAEAVAEPSRKYGSSAAATTATTQRDVSSAGTPGALAKRKSVRLTENQLVAPSHQAMSSPASSIRSGQGAAPRHGILLNSNSPNGQGSSDVGASSTWNTRVPASRTVDDSSDEDEDAVAYRKARKAFSKALKDKGKGKAVEQ